MRTVNRKTALIGLAVRYPAIRRLAADGLSPAELQSRFQMPLDESDVTALASVTDEEVRAAEQALQKPFAEKFPYGI